jgi:hypothetical protein
LLPENSSEVIQFYQWLAVELAPTIQGSKPSTILSLTDSRYQAVLTLWRRCGYAFIEQTMIRFRILRHSPSSEIVLFYRSDAMEKCLQADLHQSFLADCGYPVAEGIEACLILLEQRFQSACPHEIGLLLGIPLKDVLGFMGLSDLPLTCRKEWCIYGDPADSMVRIQQFAEDRSLISRCLVAGINAFDILCGKLEALPERTLY